MKSIVAVPAHALLGVAVPGVLKLTHRQHVGVQAPVAVVHALPHLQCRPLVDPLTAINILDHSGIIKINNSSALPSMFYGEGDGWCAPEEPNTPNLKRD